MEIKIICQLCRQKFSCSTNTETVFCPHCLSVNPNRALRKRSSSQEHVRISHPLIISNSIREKQKKNLRGSTQKPAAASGSLSTNYPKLCDLDCSGPSAKQRAVLCGVNYKRWKYELNETINDVLNMKDLLIKKYEFREENILVLTEEESNSRLIPTKANIKTCLTLLVKECGSGDSFVFYYSGHGFRQFDSNNDGLDGFDETICPVNFQKEGMIFDTEIYFTIVKPLPEGVTLHAIVDACHRGTILDLEHVYDKERRKWVDNRSPSARKQTSGGKAYSISACEDDQVASDKSAFSSKSMNGVMTFILIEILRTRQSMTYWELLDEVQKRIEQVNQLRCLWRFKSI